MKELYKNLDNLRGYVNIEEALELIYVTKAWIKLSDDAKLEEELTFDNFYSKKVEVKKLASIFKELAKNIKFFSLYHFNVKSYDDDKLIKILGIVKNIEKLPTVHDSFYSDKGKASDFTVSNQVAELGIKLLNGDSKELYVPFTNGFAYTQYTDKRIYADNQFPKAELYAEVIKILEDKEIDFSLTNALENPTFTNHDAPYLLKEFESVLSFPAFGLRGKLDTSKDKFHRFQFQRGAVLDIAHFEHILAQTKSKAVVLMPVGFTYRAGNEEQFRKYLVDKNYIEAIIQLPPNLHSATSIETTFFVINKQKIDNKVLFINLKDESFITRDRRKLVFKSLDEIVNIYKNKKEIESISCVVTNEKIEKNNYSFAIDRYVISQEAKELQEVLKQFELIMLDDIAEIRRSQLFKDEGEGKEVYEISPSDFNKAGYTLECGKVKQIGSQYRRLQTYKLEPYDVLLSTKGTIGKVALIGEISDAMIASQAIQVIRVQDTDKKEKAISLYMFFKSNLGQTILSSLVAGVAMPQIATSEIKQLKIPILSKEQKKQTVLNFNNEIKLYNEIDKINTGIEHIHSSFLGVNV